MGRFNLANFGGFLTCTILIFISSSHRICYADTHSLGKSSSTTFNVLSFGAKGNGVTDDSKAFLAAWQAACKVASGVVLAPSGYKFLLQTTTFEGRNCQPNITVQVDGTIIAPAKIKDWVNIGFQWLLFDGLSRGLTLRGRGIVDGQGAVWWGNKESMDQQSERRTLWGDRYYSEARPNAIRIASSTKVTVTGITVQNPPLFHIYIDNCIQVEVFDFTVASPGNSPNTDGIHLTKTQHVDIHNCTISSGDDCVSIQQGCSDINVYNVNCGPGHGYSIGGLGSNQTTAVVSDISVVNSRVSNSLTGVRIKTFQGAKGSVHNVTFSNIIMTDVQTAIVIDQNYCDSQKACNKDGTTTLAIRDIMYAGINGTYIQKPVYLNCNAQQPCRNITVANINLVPSPAGKLSQPSCSNAFGKVLTTTAPPLRGCIISDGNKTQGVEKEFQDLLLDSSN